MVKFLLNNWILTFETGLAYAYTMHYYHANICAYWNLTEHFAAAFIVDLLKYDVKRAADS